MSSEREQPRPDADDCRGKLHPMAVLGIKLFNERRYWKAHEALEAAWLAEAGQIRHLYRGILQVGVAYWHVQQGNYPGAMKLYQRSQNWLEPFPDHCRGIDVGRLRSDFAAVMDQARRLGPEGIRQLDHSLLKPVLWELEGEPGE